MLKRKYYFLFICFFIRNFSFSQDIHWSQFNDNPLFQNPGNSGNFIGDYRFISNYRNQWKSVTTPFSTLNFSFDTKHKKHQNLGYGGLFFHDVSGDGKFRTIELQANLSYKLKMSKNENHILLLGLNLGLNHRQINFNLLSFDNQYNGMVYDPNLPSNEIYSSQKNTNLSIGTGIVHEFHINKTNKISSGISFFNLNKPNQGFYNEIVYRDIRTTFYIKGIRKINFDINIIPSIQLNIQGKYKELIIGSSLKYSLIDKPRDYKAVYAGLWFRNRDAFYITTGLDYQNWFFGLSYDINVSKLVPASNLRGGFEAAIRYIIFSVKPKNVIHRICPDYI